MRRNIVYIGISLLLASCNTLNVKNQQEKEYTLALIKGDRIFVSETKKPDKELEKLVSGYKGILDEQMNVVIGRSAQDMTLGRPESLLTNLTSDAIKKLSMEHTDNVPIDLAVMNVHGHRAPLSKGDITVGNIFEIYSFDNEIVVLQLKGSDLINLFNDYAKIGGAGISSNARLIITQEGKLVDAILDNHLVDENEVYNIVTLDYLAEGNDGMDTFKKALSVKRTGIILRDYMMDYVKKQTNEGKPIESKLDGRIAFE